MSNRTAYFGGSPGPPNDRPSPHHAHQLYSEAPPVASVAYGGALGVSLPSGEMSSLNPVCYGHPGMENVITSNYRPILMNPYHYGASDPYYFGASAPFFYSGVRPARPHFVNSPHGAFDLHGSHAEYAEWSTNDYPSGPVWPGSELRSEGESSQSHDFKSPASDGSGKSKRFSQQRNIREGTDVSKHQEPSDRPRMKKHEIRFSHQKQQQNQKSKKGSLPKEEANPSKDQMADEDAVREVDKGSGQSKKNDSKVSGEKSKQPRKKTAKYGASSESQIGVLLEQLTKGTYECMVCCDRVKQQHAVWNCSKCYHVFHMGCIKKWARSPAAQAEEEGWRCPGCQNATKKFPSTYTCYCGKVDEPEWNRRETPHSCGEVCGKKRSNNESCTHPCNILCHPGPCPPCPASVIKACLCGKITSKVRCSQQKPLTCDEPCGKDKNCTLHRCDALCHSGECSKCDVVVPQSCFCEKVQRTVLCGSDDFVNGLSYDHGVYSCGGKCGKMLTCGNHECAEACHDGDCKSCPLLPEAVKTCPCTQTKLSDLQDENGVAARKTCTDPISLCGKVCGKPLKCGGDSIHTCKQKCHAGECPPCPDGETNVRCRCGKSEKDVPCSEIDGEPYICDRRCNKKRKCGRHKCGKTCCTDSEHVCTQPCGRKLECKLHRCEETCHRGACHSCYNVSFDELRCHCGAEVMYPPIPCGTNPPECNRPCVRQHRCFHPVNHNCHSEEKCPPCVVLMKKKCNCGRLMRNNIPCHQENVSCGAPCKKPLPCGHNCHKPCHQGLCMAEEDACTQPCGVMRVECIHPCANPCHRGKPCPQSSCKAMVTLKCGCGHREMQVECFAGGAAYQRLSSEAFARQQQESSVDISNLFQGAGNNKVLPCDEKCSTIERNRRMAEALEIEEQAESQSEQFLYSPFLQSWAKLDPLFVKSVEQDLANIVEAVQWLDHNKRDHAFPSMKRDKRQVVHELAEAFCCRSLSVDEEPNRSVIVTAVRGFSKIPRTLLSETVAKTTTPQFTNKRMEPPVTPSSADSSKRLLSSMKLVSLTSKSPQAGSKIKVANPESKRPASIPRMPNYSALSKPSAALPFQHPARPPADDKQAYRNGPGPRPTNKSAASFPPANQYAMGSGFSKAAYSTSTSSNAKAKEDPDIDYFDMTG